MRRRFASAPSAGAPRKREVGRANVSEAAIFSAIAEQRRVLAKAEASSKAARRAIARLPNRQSSATEAKPPAVPEMTPQGIAGEDDARVPCVVEDEAWKTEFLS